MVTISERDSIIQVLLNLRKEVDEITFPKPDITEEVESIDAKIAVAIASVEEEKDKLREAVEEQKVILINMPVEVVDKPKKGLFGRWK